MSWWSKLRGWFGAAAASPSAAPPEPPAAGSKLPPVSWLAADQTRFGVPVLDLGPITQTMISTTSDPANAERALSWGRTLGEGLPDTLDAALEVGCALRYPAADPLPEGLLFTPREMEDKWVLAWRGGRLLLARSWTGDLALIADARLEGDALVVERLREVAGSPLSGFGDLVEVFDWVVRTHALGEVLPIPVSERGAGTLELGPLIGFSAFGRRLLCAARSWAPPPPSRPLRSDGVVLRAAREGDLDRLRALAAAGEPLSPASPTLGYTPLHVAAIQGNTAVAELLLELGADANAAADRGMSALGVAVVHRAPMALLRALVAHGADPRWANDDGFGALHAMAEVDHPEALAWLLEQGLDLEATTKHGHTPLHIAAALGHLKALAALLEAGADPEAPSPGGTPREVALAEGKPAAAAALERWLSSR